MHGASDAWRRPIESKEAATIEPVSEGSGKRAGAMTIVARGGDYLCGRIAPALVVRVMMPLAVLCFVVSVALALAFFPTLYDLRHRWLSSLASPRHNRLGYFYLGAGLAAVSVLLIPIPGYLSRRMASYGRVRRVGLLFLAAGVVGLFLLSVESILQAYGRVRGLHRILSIVTISGLTVGFLCFAALSIARACATHSKRWPALLACFVLAAPGIGTGLTHLFLEFGSGGVGWATSRAAKQAAPFFRTLPFWEWTAVLSLFAGGYLCVWAASLQAPAPAHPEEAAREADLVEQLPDAVMVQIGHRELSPNNRKDA
jgi:hypothetical protein